LCARPCWMGIGVAEHAAGGDATAQATVPEVPFFEARSTYLELRDELDRAYGRVMESGRYILGEEVAAFEEEFAQYCGAAHAVAVDSGLDALKLALEACGVGPGDEVIVPTNTFIGTWLAVSHTGATPVPVEPDPRTHNLDPERVARAIRPSTRAIVPVHLYGQPADMPALLSVAAHHGLKVIEDAAQAHGASLGGRRTGTFGDAAAFSFYPTKNLGAFGDGGAVVTGRADVAERVRSLRNYGSTRKHSHEIPGFNSRLDPLQAAFLRVKLARLNAWNERRGVLARFYLNRLAGVDDLVLPEIPEDSSPVWHLFVVRHPRRDAIRDHLARQGIETAIHYPVPPHLSPCYATLGWKRGDFDIAEELADTVLSLPMGPHVAANDAELVVTALAGR
jgi:dTDP-4-amino-4,6-dideoxygalactose transaminase